MSVCLCILSLFTLEKAGECCGRAGLFVDLTKLQDRWELQTVVFERRYLLICQRENL